MTLYRDMTTPELVDRALNWDDRSAHVRRITYALGKRLEQEHERANRHKDKLTKVARDYVNKARRIAHLEGHLAHLTYTLDTKSRPPAGYIKVAKPHVSLVKGAGDPPVWRCAGAYGVSAHGRGPGEAYAAWRVALERQHGARRR